MDNRGKAGVAIGGTSYFDIMLGRKGGVGKTIAAATFASMRTTGRAAGMEMEAGPWGLRKHWRLDLRSVAGSDAEAVEQRLEQICRTVESLPQGFNALVDTSSRHYIECVSSLLTGDIVARTARLGRSVRLHTVVAGGACFSECLRTLEELSETFENVPIVVWLNPYLGQSSLHERLSEVRAYKDAKAVICLPVAGGDSVRTSEARNPGYLFPNVGDRWGDDLGSAFERVLQERDLGLDAPSPRMHDVQRARLHR